MSPAPSQFWPQPACGIAIQPIVDLSASHRIRCGELLVRPTHPNKTVPEVLNDLERTGQMTDFTLGLLKWASASTRRLSVNVPPAVLCDEQFIEAVIELAATAQNLPFVEVIEDPVADEAALADQLVLLRRHGYRIAFDDYADTPAHRARLESAPWSRVKIDRSLLGDRTALTKAARRCGAVTSDVVVEGVETQLDLNAVESLGSVGLVQGFFVGRPELVIDLSMHTPYFTHHYSTAAPIALECSSPI